MLPKGRNVADGFVRSPGKTIREIWGNEERSRTLQTILVKAELRQDALYTRTMSGAVCMLAAGPFGIPTKVLTVWLKAPGWVSNVSK